MLRDYTTKMKTLTQMKATTVLFAAAAALLFSSCDSFLDVEPKGSLSEPVLANEQGVRALLIGAYGALDGAQLGNAWPASPDNWAYGSVAGGDAHKGSTAGDQGNILTIAQGNVSPSTGYLNSYWNAMYEGISRANAVLGLLNEVEGMNETAQAIAAGEARFLRGHYYFELKRKFNMVPWIDENTTEYKTPNDLDIWPNIEADFAFALENLPATQSEGGRVNRWAAAAYLAKTYVYQEKWAAAKPLYDDIIANGVTSEGVPYDLRDNFRDNWEPSMEAGNPEAVFEVEQVAILLDGDIWNSNHGQRLNFPYNSPFGCCGFFQPTQDLVNSYRVGPNNLPLIDSYRDEVVNNDIRTASTEPFEPYAGPVDPRLDWTVGRRGAPFLDWGPHPGITWVRDVATSGSYHSKKNVYWQATMDDEMLFTWSPGTSKNVNIIRFADVLLMAAEVEVEVGTIDQARTYVNRVRERAATSEWVSNDHNRPYAFAEVDSEAEMLSLTDVGLRDWVVRNDTETTFVFLGGDASDLASWNEYAIPEYQIGLYDSFPSQDFARDAIHFERKLELAMEGHRFYDLVRWGKGDELNEVWSWESQFVPITANFSFTPGKNEYLPIPQNQIDISTVDGLPTLEQNPAYN